TSAGTALADRPIDFDTEIMPVLTRLGCNAGSCHGAAIGRGGFKLSLLGSSAALDHDAIVRHLEGRRVNLARPDRSLLLLKPSEQLGHEGGLVMEEDSEGFKRISAWIREGARRDGSRELIDLTLSPQRATLPKPGETVRIGITASYSDGSSDDVTRWTVFQAADQDAVSVDTISGDMTVQRRGVHIVIARFMDRVLPIRLTVPMLETASQTQQLTEKNEVDRYINRELQRLRLPVSPATDDWRFIRRVTLDLTGRMPTAEAVKRFMSDSNPEKREQIVVDLLASDQFAEYWALKWANDMGIDSRALQPEGAKAFHRWLQQQLRNDTPWDEMAIAMLTQSGDSYEDGSLNFLRSAGSPGELAEHTSRTLMGVRLQCANCHDHPLDHWKQDDYHGLAAIFAKLKRQRIVSESTRGEVTHPVTGNPAIPRIPGDRYLQAESDGRTRLAEWLTSPENPYFAKAIVNRIWQQLMGRGLVDPVDDLRATNPATHPELLQWLADDFVEHGYSVQHTIGTICQSAAYARASTPLPDNESDASFYSHALVKSLEAEVIADAITDITGVPLKFRNADLPRTVSLTDNRMQIPTLDVLGRCDREASCSQADSSASLARSLHLINGELINQRVTAADGRLSEWLASTSNNAEVLNQIFLETLSQPNMANQPYWQTELAALIADDDQARRAFFEDLLWGLLTSRAFMTNR
ncbi:MAG: DUF1549 and DUF1553 domain-containing protein, partial [Planctomycetota bacterium]